jgi:nicotinate-nucleotide adenylyltransferase
MIGLFGGSFDPIHHGHLLVAQAVREALQLEQLRFVPTRESPFKMGQTLAPGELRVRMIQAAVGSDPGYQVDPIELHRPGPSYTIDTLRALHQREPDQRWGLLLGADAAADFGKWREAAAIAQLADLIIFARAGVTPPPLDWPARIVTVPAIEISATEVRRRAAAGRSLRYWVPDPVAGIIHDEGLYLPDA